MQHPTPALICQHLAAALLLSCMPVCRAIQVFQEAAIGNGHCAVRRRHEPYPICLLAWQAHGRNLQRGTSETERCVRSVLTLEHDPGREKCAWSGIGTWYEVHLPRTLKIRESLAPSKMLKGNARRMYGWAKPRTSHTRYQNPFPAYRYGLTHGPLHNRPLRR